MPAIVHSYSVRDERTVTHHSPATPDDIFSLYEAGLAALQQTLGEQHPSCGEFFTYDGRLKYNISHARQYGDTEIYRNERAQIIAQLDTITLSAVSMSFTALCQQSITRTRLLHWLHNASPPLAGADLQRLAHCLLACQAITHIVPLDWSTAFRNRIDKLVAMVQRYENDQKRVEELDDILDLIKPLVVSRTHLRSLETILRDVLSDVPVETVRGWYYTSLPPRGGYATLPDYYIPSDENVSNILSTVLSKLADIKKPSDGYPIPVAKFVHRLLEDVANDIPPEQQQAIHAWLQQVGFAVPTPPAPDPTTPEASTSVNAYLMILFQPDQYNPEQHEVRAWLMSDEHVPNSDERVKWRSYDPNNPQIITLHPDTPELDDVLSGVLENIWKQCQSHVTSRTNLTIEFFLPLMLLLHHVEYIRIKVGSSKRPRPRFVGCVHRVVVRAQDRYDPIDHDYYYNQTKWQDRWRNSTACPLPNGNVIKETSADDCENEDSLHAMLSGEKDACAIVHTAVPPKCHRQQHLETLFWAALDAGFPIMLLPRYPEDNPDLVKQEMMGLLAQQCSLVDLPQVVTDKRLWAVEQAQHEHPYYHLTLVWDDPTRPPPDERGKPIPVKK